MNTFEDKNNFLIYKNKDGNIVVDAIYKDETLWLTQKGMAKVFDVGVPAISKHLKNIFEEQELNEKWLFPKWKIPLNMVLLMEKHKQLKLICIISML